MLLMYDASIGTLTIGWTIRVKCCNFDDNNCEKVFRNIFHNRRAVAVVQLWDPRLPTKSVVQSARHETYAPSIYPSTIFHMQHVATLLHGWVFGVWYYVLCISNGMSCPSPYWLTNRRRQLVHWRKNCLEVYFWSNHSGRYH